MIQSYLDPNSYTFAGGFPVSTGKDLTVPDSLVRSQTMLVRWDIRQLAKGGTIEQIAPATLTAVLEIPGMGEFDPIEFQLTPSNQGRKRVQIITLDPALSYKLTFSQIDELVTNSVLEFYTSNLTMGTFQNPVEVNTDFSPLIEAINASSDAQIAATQEQTALASRIVTQEIESNYVPTVWSNVPSNHVAVTPDPTRIGGSFYNKGNKAVAIDKYLDIATKTPASQADGLLQPGGIYTFKPEEAHMGYLISLVAAATGQSIAINLQK